MTQATFDSHPSDSFSHFPLRNFRLHERSARFAGSVVVGTKLLDAERMPTDLTGWHLHLYQHLQRGHQWKPLHH